MVRVLLDTDVCLDSITGRKPWDKDANRIFHSATEEMTDIFISGLSFSNMFYLLRKEHGAKRTIEKMSAMRELVSVSSVDERVVDSAFATSWHDFEDALQFYSALNADCDVLITRNISDYKKADDLSVLSSSEFVAQYLIDAD